MDNLKQILLEISEKWKAMERDTEDKRKAAEEFYKDKLMPLVKEYFLQNNRKNVKCEGLILTLGTSYEPLVLSISALNPKRVLILYTKKSMALLDDVIAFTNLKPSQCTTSLVDSDNPLLLYKEIKEIYEEWNRPKNIYVDFTGGTKCMAASCAMAGSAIGAKLIYVAGDYLGDLKKPDPGTEKLYDIDDPYKVFGDLERDKAISLFNKMDFNSAYRIFSELENKVPGSNKEYTALRYISRAYDSWDSLNLDQANKDMHKCLDIINNEAKVERSFILGSYEDIIRKQSDVINKLSKIHINSNHKNEVFKDMGYVIASFYENAMRRERQEKYEMASLLLYRILEMIEQKRLWNYGSFDTSNADYEKLKWDKDELLKKINMLTEKIGTRPMYNLEKEVGLLNGYLILAAINDDFFKGKNESQIVSELQEIKNTVHVRNNSIFAHGFEFIDELKYKPFKEMVDRYISTFCEIEEIDRNKVFEIMKFIELK